MLSKLYKTKLFSTYIPLVGIVYFTSCLFYMAGEQNKKNTFKNKDLN